MTCTKKAFETQKEAQKRVNEINKENGTNKEFKDGKILTLRYYVCKDCGKYHLSSMSKHNHKYFTNKDFRKSINRKSFLNRETDFWKQRLGIQD